MSVLMFKVQDMQLVFRTPCTVYMLRQLRCTARHQFFLVQASALTCLLYGSINLGNSKAFELFRCCSPSQHLAPCRAVDDLQHFKRAVRSVHGALRSGMRVHGC